MFFTWGNKTKGQSVVEDVDIYFCSKYLSDKLDLGNKHKETHDEGKGYSQQYWDIAHHV